MGKLDWKKADNYSYTKGLSNQGWAWEFLRRSHSYRKAYKEIAALVEKDCGGDWSKQPKNCYYPPKGSLEPVQEWAIRVEAEGQTAEILPASENCARQWLLKDMYVPDKRYFPEEIFFISSQTFPLFYASSVTVSNDFSAEDQEWIGSVYMDETLRKLRPIEEMAQSPEGNHIVFVAYDASANLVRQIEQAEAFLASYQRMIGKKTTGRKHKDKWKCYLRMLDADNAETGLPLTDIIKEIQPKGSPGSPNYDQESKVISDYAGSTLEQARRIANNGFRRLISEIDRK